MMLLSRFYPLAFAGFASRLGACLADKDEAPGDGTRKTLSPGAFAISRKRKRALGGALCFSPVIRIDTRAREKSKEEIDVRQIFLGNVIFERFRKLHAV